MARGRFRSIPASIAKRIAEGRGQGTGGNYRPWLEVQDFPSLGVSHRLLGLKTEREHHLFSDLELTVFLIYDVLTSIIDIREQFPLLPLDETLKIAKKIGVKHPSDPATGYPVVMTTDFFLKLRVRREVIFHARTAKYREYLADQRVIEKFEIERRYWLSRDINWGYVTEEDISPTLAENAALIHPCYFPTDLRPLTERDVRKIGLYLASRVRREEIKLSEIVHDSDQKFELTPGKSFSVICHLIARGIWRVDLLNPISMSERLVLL